MFIYMCFVYMCIMMSAAQLNPPVFLGQNTPAVPQRVSNQWLDPNFRIPSIPSTQDNNEQSWQSSGNQFRSTNMNTLGPANNRNQFRRQNGAQFIPSPVRPLPRQGNQLNSRRVGPMFQTLLPTQDQPWAPGEPLWIFPGTGPFRETCQRRGCPLQGTQCVFWGGFCPPSVRRTPCRCERGCRVDRHFIPFGRSKVVDQCNNVCRCTSREGIAQCTTRRC